jgi:universal stress protein A
MRVETVLCPIDFSAMSDRELRVAVELCETFGARLVLHHNVSAASPGVARAWEWEKTHHAGELSEAEAERRLGNVLARLPDGIDAEAIVSRGPVGMVLLRLAVELPADVMVLACHGGSSEDHASTTERVIEDCACPVLTLHHGKGEAHPFRLRAGGGQPVRVVVPTDFSPGAAQAVGYACALARAVPLEVHLVHVLPGRALAAVPDDRVAPARGDRPPAELAAVRRLAALVPPGLESAVRCHLKAGSAVDQIVALAERLDAGFIVMGEHARGLFRRFFTRDTSRQLLHRASCAVWYVPPDRGVQSAAAARGR